MAKMFYNMEETMGKLACTEDKIKQLAQDGTLREFKDCGKSIFKVDEVDTLALSMGGVSLGDTGDGLSNTGLGGSNMDISLADTAEDVSLGGSTLGGTGLSLGDSATSIGLSATSTSSGFDLNASDSLGELSLDDTTPANDDTVVTSFGTNALGATGLGDEEFALEDLDDQIGDAISLDSGSSGSGLLDLSREADETSLGAELLEEIYPGSDDDFGDAKPGGALNMGTSSPTAISDEPISANSGSMAVPTPSPMVTARTVQMYDESSGKFGIMLLAPLLILIYMAFASFAAASGIKLAFINETLNPNIAYIAIGGLLWVIIFLVASMMASSPSGPAKPAKPKEPKKAKTKAPKKSKKK